MREQNTMKVVPLDVVPERRTERCSRDFGAVIAFVSCGSDISRHREGEISWAIGDRSLSSTLVD